MKKLVMTGNNVIDQFLVEEPGLYAWRNIRNPDAEWVFGHLNVGDKIEGQYEGCGPLVFEVK